MAEQTVFTPLSNISEIKAADLPVEVPAAVQVGEVQAEVSSETQAEVQAVIQAEVEATTQVEAPVEAPVEAQIEPQVQAEAEVPVEVEPEQQLNPGLYKGTLIPASTRLQNLIKTHPGVIVCPGVYDGLSARIALEVGFDSLYMTGAGTSASRLGMADLALATLADMRAHAEMIANLEPQGPPVIADMDAGYGGPMMVYRAVCEYIRAGVAGFHLEDQLLTKRCGHLKGKAVVSREEWYSRLRAALQAKKNMGSDIVLIARTDALQKHGIDECIERLKYARELGCDVGLCEGFQSKEQARKTVAALPGWPLLMNSVENGASPLITVDEANEMGFKLMIFSFASIAPAYQAIKATLEKLKTHGVVGTKATITPRKIFEVCGLEQLIEVDMKSGGLAFAEGV